MVISLLMIEKRLLENAKNEDLGLTFDDVLLIEGWIPPNSGMIFANNIINLTEKKLYLDKLKARVIPQSSVVARSQF